MLLRRKTMKNHMLIVLGAVGLLLATGCATTADKQAQAEAARAAQRSAYLLQNREKVTATATVQAVDLEKRQVVLKGRRGKLHMLAVSEEVRNLPQVRVGDQVELTYYEALALSLEKSAPGSIPARKDTVTVERAAPGQKPAGMVRQDVEVVANVTAINNKTRKVTLRGPERTVIVKAPEDVDINQIKVGDRVRVNYVEALAIAVEPWATKKKPARR
jgi:uncharacterized protein YceK